MKESKIEWCDHTFNPWKGCRGVSPGCKHCYAKDLVERWGGNFSHRTRTTPTYWKQPLKWNREAGGAEHRPRVFCASLADWLDDEVPIKWLADLMDLIRMTPNLDWLLLTKRPKNFRPRLERIVTDISTGLELAEWIYSWLGEPGCRVMKQIPAEPPANIWIGTTVEDQARADERIPLLLDIPAKVRFLSCEPLLGPVDLGMPGFPSKPEGYDALTAEQKDRKCEEQTRATYIARCGNGIHWVIGGGESGPKARPMHPDWARSLRDQCQAAGVPFLFKQWGEWAPYTTRNVWTESKPLTCIKFDGDTSWWAGDEDTTINYSEDYEESDVPIERIGKKAAGRLLDGREWNEFPKSEVAS